ncbi:MAG: peptide deformylase [Pseudomonadales bacterium]|nr:peptide deformylase [Pseudomonadales bacterium]NRA15760.1 peptide deformylase [Oceanospirillaceae bacterium]
MALLTILEFPDPKLRTIAREVQKFDHRIINIIDDMFETMYQAPGIGLAATQVDIHQRIITIDISEDKNQPLVLINPHFSILDDDTEMMQEGCLSVPGFYEEIERPKHIRVLAQDKTGKALNFTATDLLAVCIQHEIDHLDGKLFVDYLSKLKRSRIKTKLEKAHRQQNLPHS